MRLSFTIKNVGVDAGMIMICDEEYYENFGGPIFDEKISKKIEIEPGKYKVDYHIPETWNGEVKGSGTLVVKSGKVIISDPCYCVESSNDSYWSKFLDETSFGSEEPEGTIIIDSMGGDGEYDVYLSFRSVN